MHPGPEDRDLGPGPSSAAKALCGAYPLPRAPRGVSGSFYKAGVSLGGPSGPITVEVVHFPSLKVPVHRLLLSILRGASPYSFAMTVTMYSVGVRCGSAQTKQATWGQSSSLAGSLGT